ncbi:hypothetical protein ScPMuIL_011759 [Solemya velum]
MTQEFALLAPFILISILDYALLFIPYHQQLSDLCNMQSIQVKLEPVSPSRDNCTEDTENAADPNPVHPVFLFTHSGALIKDVQDLQHSNKEMLSVSSTDEDISKELKNTSPHPVHTVVGEQNNFTCVRGSSNGAKSNGTLNTRLETKIIKCQTDEKSMNICDEEYIGKAEAEEIQHVKMESSIGNCSIKNNEDFPRFEVPKIKCEKNVNPTFNNPDGDISPLWSDDNHSASCDIGDMFEAGSKSLHCSTISSDLSFSAKLLLLSKKAKDDFAQCLSSVTTPMLPSQTLTSGELRKNASQSQTVLEHLKHRSPHGSSSDRKVTVEPVVAFPERNCDMEVTKSRSEEDLLRNSTSKSDVFRSVANPHSQIEHISSDHLLSAIKCNELTKNRTEETGAASPEQSQGSGILLGGVLKMLLTKNWMLSGNQVHFSHDDENLSESVARIKNSTNLKQNPEQRMPDFAQNSMKKDNLDQNLVNMHSGPPRPRITNQNVDILCDERLFSDDDDNDDVALEKNDEKDGDYIPSEDSEEDSEETEQKSKRIRSLREQKFRNGRGFRKRPHDFNGRALSHLHSQQLTSHQFSKTQVKKSSNQAKIFHPKNSRLYWNSSNQDMNIIKLSKLNSNKPEHKQHILDASSNLSSLGSCNEEKKSNFSFLRTLLTKADGINCSANTANMLDAPCLRNLLSQPCSKEIQSAVEKIDGIVKVTVSNSSNERTQSSKLSGILREDLKSTLRCREIQVEGPDSCTKAQSNVVHGSSTPQCMAKPSKKVINNFDPETSSNKRRRISTESDEYLRSEQTEAVDKLDENHDRATCQPFYPEARWNSRTPSSTQNHSQDEYNCYSISSNSSDNNESEQTENMEIHDEISSRTICVYANDSPSLSGGSVIKTEPIIVGYDKNIGDSHILIEKLETPHVDIPIKTNEKHRNFCDISVEEGYKNTDDIECAISSNPVVCNSIAKKTVSGSDSPDIVNNKIIFPNVPSCANDEFKPSVTENVHSFSDLPTLRKLVGESLSNKCAPNEYNRQMSASIQCETSAFFSDNNISKTVHEVNIKSEPLMMGYGIEPYSACMKTTISTPNSKQFQQPQPIETKTIDIEQQVFPPCNSSMENSNEFYNKWNQANPNTSQVGYGKRDTSTFSRLENEKKSELAHFKPGGLEASHAWNANAQLTCEAFGSDGSSVQVKLEPHSEGVDYLSDNTSYPGNYHGSQSRFLERSQKVTEPKMLETSGSQKYTVPPNIQTIYNNITVKPEPCDLVCMSKTCASVGSGRCSPGTQQKNVYDKNITSFSQNLTTVDPSRPSREMYRSSKYMSEDTLEYPIQNDFNKTRTEFSLSTNASTLQKHLTDGISSNMQRENYKSAADILKQLAMFKEKNEEQNSSNTLTHSLYNDACASLPSHRTKSTFTNRNANSGQMCNRSRIELSKLLTEQVSSCYNDRSDVTSPIMSKILGHSSPKASHGNNVQLLDSLRTSSHMYKREGNGLVSLGKIGTYGAATNPPTNSSPEQNMEKTRNSQRITDEQSILANLLKQPQNNLVTQQIRNQPKVAANNRFIAQLPILQSLLIENGNLGSKTKSNKHVTLKRTVEPYRYSHLRTHVN